MSSIISCRLMGGLGNQLFQIFTTIAYAVKYKRKLILPYSEELNTGKTRPTYWDTFLSGLIQFTTYNINSGYSTDTLYKLPTYNEPVFRYTEIPNFTNNEFSLYGYFQSYKYFEHTQADILSYIKLYTQQEQIRNEYSTILSDSTHNISMHFRIGDYKDEPDYFPIMPYIYYENALSTIMTDSLNDLKRDFISSSSYKTKPIISYKVLYFCEREDNDVVNNIIVELRKRFPIIDFSKVDDTIVDWKQMLIMSCCQDNIIANSTFSWWGGYFNQNSQKRVFYPAIWFGSKLPHDATDLFPNSWKKISW